MSITDEERMLPEKTGDNRLSQDKALMDLITSNSSRIKVDNLNSLNIDLMMRKESYYSSDRIVQYRNPNKEDEYSEVEAAILKSSEPINVNETEEIIINGEKGIWANKEESLNWKGTIPLSEYRINEDPNPQIVHKKPSQNIVYHQEVAIRYLRPPTPPPPGPIFIQQEANMSVPPAPPLVIRQQPPRPATPPPLVIREAPPPPPPQVGKKIITISGKRLPPPPRKVIIERLAPMPNKPQSIIIERWLPYRQVKRKVIFARSSGTESTTQKPKNVIVQWQTPQVHIQKEFKDLGIVKANPLEYVQRYGSTLKRAIELPNFVKEIKPPSGLALAADSSSNSIYQLEGDIYALNLVDLEREGLVEYKYLLKKSESFNKNALDFSKQREQNKNLLKDLIRVLSLDSNETVSLSEAERIMSKIYNRMGRPFREEETKSFFSNVDIDSAGRICLSDIKKLIEQEFV